MQRMRGNLFDPSTYRDGEIQELANFRPDAIVVTTNGFVKKNGEAVMGRGCAKELASLSPGIEGVLGKLMQKKGNIVHMLANGNIKVYSFPVKPITITCNGNNVVGHMRQKFKIGDIVPGWAAIADLELIKQSAIQLKEIADRENYTHVVIPRPGCGAGELSWDEVDPELDEILDDRFYSITK